jgi:hypothetical protein
VWLVKLFFEKLDMSTDVVDLTAGLHQPDDKVIFH